MSWLLEWEPQIRIAVGYFAGICVGWVLWGRPLYRLREELWVLRGRFARLSKFIKKDNIRGYEE